MSFLSLTKLDDSDGVNFDFEDELEAGSEKSKAYTNIFKQTVAQFHQIRPNSQVSFNITIETLTRDDRDQKQVSIDVAWSPDNIDKRGYEYALLAKYADKGKTKNYLNYLSFYDYLIVFVMSYDEQSQMWENSRCQARANSPLMQTFAGLRKYLQLGVEPGKLVLGTPWYGYRYPCQGTGFKVCHGYDN